MGSLLPTRVLQLVMIAVVVCGHAVADVVQNVNVPGAQYTQLQPAIDAAAEGDVLLVTGGQYLPFSIDGKSLTLAVVSGQVVLVEGTIRIANLQLSQHVELIGFSSQAQYPSQSGLPGMPGLSIENCLGYVRVQEGQFIGGYSSDGSSSNPATSRGGHGIHLIGSARVALVDTTGAGGAGKFRPCGWFTPGPAGNGLHVETSRVTIQGGTYRGGEGGESEEHGGRGGNGFHALDGTHLATGATCIGGAGGQVAGFPPCGNMQTGDGGFGLYSEAAIVHAADLNLILGPAGSGAAPSGVPGAPFNPSAAILTLPGRHRALAAARIVSDAGAGLLTAKGAHGDAVRFADSKVPQHLVVPPLSNTLLILAPDILRRASTIGTIPASGTANLTFPIPDLQGGSEAECVGIQLALASPLGTANLSQARFQVRIDRASRPDCNGNGVNDFLDVIEGTAPDLNRNLVPDSCDWQGPDWYVDAAASTWGDGSPGFPFRTIAAASAVALSGQTIHLRDGIYDGPENRNIDFAGRALTIRSINGPNACFIDCQGQERAFVFQTNETAASRLEGVTIANSITTYKGGAIFVWMCSPSIIDCVFTNCASLYRGAGALWGEQTNVWIEGCVFRNNNANGSGTSADRQGGAISIEFGSPRILGCVFEFNRATSTNGYAGAVALTNTSARISHCVFTDNHAAQGGALVITNTTTTTVSIDHCLFLGNGANTGGAMLVQAGAGTISSCSFSANTATTNAALRLLSAFGTGWSMQNSIVWGNGTLPMGLQGSEAKLSVSSCDVQGGLASIGIGGGAQLTWGAGNIDVDPQFVDAQLRLSGTSPCIDAGSNSLVVPDSFDLDGDGNVLEPVPLDLSFLPRFVDIPTIPDTGFGSAPLVDMGCQERQTP